MTPERLAAIKAAAENVGHAEHDHGGGGPMMPDCPACEARWALHEETDRETVMALVAMAQRVAKLEGALGKWKHASIQPNGSASWFKAPCISAEEKAYCVQHSGRCAGDVALLAGPGAGGG